MEDLVKTQLELGENKTGVVKELINEKTKRAKEWKPLLPFDMNEHEENKAGDFINKILFRHSIHFWTVSSYVIPVVCLAGFYGFTYEPFG